MACTTVQPWGLGPVPARWRGTPRPARRSWPEDIVATWQISNWKQRGLGFNVLEDGIEKHNSWNNSKNKWNFNAISKTQRHTKAQTSPASSAAFAQHFGCARAWAWAFCKQIWTLPLYNPFMAWCIYLHLDSFESLWYMLVNIPYTCIVSHCMGYAAGLSFSMPLGQRRRCSTVLASKYEKQKDSMFMVFSQGHQTGANNARVQIHNTKLFTWARPQLANHQKTQRTNGIINAKLLSRYQHSKINQAAKLGVQWKPRGLPRALFEFVCLLHQSSSIYMFLQVATLKTCR